MRLRLLLFTLFVLPRFVSHAGGADAAPPVEATELPRIAATEATNAISTFQIRPGFYLDLVAAEPLVVDPVALSFDEDGRLFVVEMRDYSEHRAEKLGRIRRLEDTDGDGHFDRSTVFAEGFGWPTAVICYDGGVFVGCSPDILYLKDTNGDGRADVRETVFTGFAAGQAKLNVQALLNSFNWGLDNRIHGATSTSGGLVRLVDSGFTRAWCRRAGLEHLPEYSVPGPRDDFAFNPRTLALYPEQGGGQHGLSFDSQGRRFTCSNSDHLRLFVFNDRITPGIDGLNLPPSLASIATDGPAAEVFRISPDEPWRIVRTRWRVAGVVGGPVEGGGRVSGYFTGATGATIYRGDAYPPEFRENAFIGDAGGNLVHRKVLRPDGVSLKAERAPDEQKSEFLASRDNWFRPVQFANAPDGTLYIADMYREVIEHPWSLPDSIKKHLDLDSGNDRGRIYRVLPDGFRQRPLPRLSRARTTELAALLEHPNGWHRDTAARLLYERHDTNAVPALTQLLLGSKSALGRLHAMRALQGLGELSDTEGLTALHDPDASMREQAVILLHAPAAAGAMKSNFVALARDASPRVRFQMALIHGPTYWPPDVKRQVFQDWPLADFADAYIGPLLLLHFAEFAKDRLVGLLASERVSNRPEAQRALQELPRAIGWRGRSDEINEAMTAINSLTDTDQRLLMTHAMAQGLRAAGRDWGSSRPMVAPLADAREALANSNAKEPVRLAAADLLGWALPPAQLSALSTWLDAATPPSVQQSILASLEQLEPGPFARAVVPHWKDLSTATRGRVVGILMKKAEGRREILAAVQGGAIRPEEIPRAAVAGLQRDAHKEVAQDAARLFAVTPESTRESVIAEFRNALSLQGTATRGQKSFQERCASCHRAGSEGFALGPDFVTIRNTGKEKLLVNILDPNREVAPQYIAYSIETKAGDTLVGIIAHETATGFTVRQAFGREDRIVRAQVQRMDSQKQSLMPEGLEAGLTPQDMADLLEFIMVSPGSPP
jgi:putative membrane-bound dehydrogenase-like protein